MPSRLPATYCPHTAISGNGRYVAYHVVHTSGSDDGATSQSPSSSIDGSGRYVAFVSGTTTRSRCGSEAR